MTMLPTKWGDNLIALPARVKYETPRGRWQRSCSTVVLPAAVDSTPEPVFV